MKNAFGINFSLIFSVHRCSLFRRIYSASLPSSCWSNALRNIPVHLTCVTNGILTKFMLPYFIKMAMRGFHSLFKLTWKTRAFGSNPQLYKWWQMPKYVGKQCIRVACTNEKLAIFIVSQIDISSPIHMVVAVLECHRIRFSVNYIHKIICKNV